MRVVVTGATGNVGTSVVDALAADPAVTSIVGLARRLPRLERPKTRWIAGDVRDGETTTTLLRGADALVHLAWRIQPSTEPEELEATNVRGSESVFRAAAEAGVRAIVYASSVGAYSPGPKDRAADETWPTDGIPTSLYSRHKARVERILDRFEVEHPGIRVVRLRKALVFKREASSEIRRLFLGPLFPPFLLKRVLVVPALANLRFQVVHSKDVGDAYRRALVGDARGAFNIAAEPVLDPPTLARLFHALAVPVPRMLVRAGMAATYRLRLQPSEPGWLDIALETPVMDVGRARRDLGWIPRRDAGEALLELVRGMIDGAGTDTPPLHDARRLLGRNIA